LNGRNQVKNDIQKKFQFYIGIYCPSMGEKAEIYYFPMVNKETPWKSANDRKSG